MWKVEYTDEFDQWWEALTEAEQDSVSESVGLLCGLGPFLGRPHADAVKGSRHSNMKELRTQHRGRPLRTFFAFDPRRSAILLIGGDKTGDDRFYERMIPLADRLYDTYLEEIRREGLI
ncbi:MAG: type II toxin-antitoxin system RelE/ParE family toxin [Phycisphaerae bacterium]|nr:type II toxin-antitoxin system RelE/ParE family toxin [Phycisphaerae bacterium]